jgi:FkbM family methyltransferase
MAGRVARIINGDAFVLCREFAEAEPVHDEWEPHVYARFREALRPGMTVLDVGASFGLYTIAAARAVGAGGRVYAFEPADRTASALRLHLRWNGVADRVEVVEAAVADRIGRAEFWQQETSFVASLIETSVRQEERRFNRPVRARRVGVVALDDFCREGHLAPDVIKVDVEGAEAAVLRGARGLLRRRRGLLFLEVHRDFAPRGAGAGAAFEELAAAGWEWEPLDEQLSTTNYACAPVRR